MRCGAERGDRFKGPLKKNKKTGFRNNCNTLNIFIYFRFEKEVFPEYNFFSLMN